MHSNPIAIIKAISGTNDNICLELYIGTIYNDMRNIIIGIIQIIAINEINSVPLSKDFVIPASKTIGSDLPIG
jgi:hypothetical protein